MSEQPAAPAIRVDIFSDVVCPWCVVGYHQLASAAEDAGIALDIHWQPFELNPTMGLEGQNVREHLAEKYGPAAGRSSQTREILKQQGEAFGFAFNYTDDMRIWNTFLAHQLIHFADEHGKGHDIKQALFKVYFTDGQNVSDMDVLADIAEAEGLDRAEALKTLQLGTYGAVVRNKASTIMDNGISGVPAMIFQGKHLVVGAQGTENYSKILSKLMEMQQEDTSAVQGTA